MNLRRLFWTRDEKKLAEVIELSAAQQNLTKKDLAELNKQLQFLSLPTNVSSLKKKEDIEVPDHAYEIFRVIYTLEEKMIDKGDISPHKMSVMLRVLSFAKISRGRLIELINYLKMNILNGTQVDDAYQRLGHLLQPSKY